MYEAALVTAGFAAGAATVFYLVYSAFTRLI
jgi:hypothetical protein